jgi:hypothetical protein
MTLFSIGEATDRGMKATFDKYGVIITKKEKIVTTGIRINKNLYRMNILSLKHEALHASRFPEKKAMARAPRTSKQFHHPENV